MNKQNINEQIVSDLKNWRKILNPYQKANNAKASLQLLTSFLPFIALWVLTYFAFQYSAWLCIPLVIINAFFLVRIFIIQHDCGHQSFFKSQTLNNIVGTFCSVFSFVPFKYWASIHSYHHGHTGQIEVIDIGDIPTATVNQYLKKSWFDKFRYRLFRLPIITFVISPIYYFTLGCRMPINKVNGLKNQLKLILRDNFWIIVTYLSVGYIIGWVNLLIIQFTILFFFGIIAFWFFYVQHQHEFSYKEWQKNWDFLLSAVKGSSYYKLPRFWHWLTGNIGFHHIHHLNSFIPNYNLSKCFKENPILTKHATEITFWQSLKMMSYKLWDEEQAKMISFAEYKLIKQIRLAQING